MNDARDELLDHLPAMRAFAISLTRDAAVADDLVQDAVIKAWTNFDKYKTGTNLRAWLIAILRNTFYSARRKSMREVGDLDWVQSEVLVAQSAQDADLQMTDFRSAFAQLSDEQREALLLVGASGFSCEEAAKMCGVAVGTIKSRMGRARQKLAELMGLEEEDTPAASDDATLSAMTAKAAPL